MKLYLVILFLALASNPVLAFQNYGIIDNDLFEKVTKSLSGARAKEDVKNIIQNHRVQATEGYQEAAEYIKEELEAAGITNVKMHKYKSDGKKRYNAYTSPMSWTVKSGILKMAAPYEKNLADYSEIPTSLSTLSNGGRWRGELIDVGSGLNDKDYTNIDVKGKIVFAYGYAGSVHRQAVIKRGAFGVVIRPADSDRPEMIDAVRYNGLWPKKDERKKVGFGFQLSRTDSDEIMNLLDSGEKVILTAEVSAKLHSGELSIISAVIVGKEKDSGQFVLIAHLDHYKPGANDNASGSAALLEIARSLNGMISSGTIERPLRSIRFLWVPEHFGTMAYLSNDIEELEGAICGINLDMVGENTKLTDTRLDVILTPASSATFFNDFIVELVKEVQRKEPKSSLGSDNLFEYKVKKFRLGSDHDMLNDPMIGIPTVALGYWSDRYHHTNEDAYDKIDATTLKRNMIIGAYSALWIANAGDAEADDLTILTFAKARERIIQLGLEGSLSLNMNSTQEQIKHLKDRIDLQTEIDNKALMSIRSLRSSENSMEEMYRVALDELGKSEKKLMLSKIGKVSSEVTNFVSGSTARIPKRKFIGPVADSYADTWFADNLGETYKWYSEVKVSNLDLIRYETVNFMDGKRNISQIHKLVSAEFGRFKVEITERIIEDLAKLKLVEWVKLN
ncbi:MAG: DUF4910 domain-containing protein [Candidatus Marinimicrobia bacterium]|nr:DUF4910 domain-containing protein [Candidatus Neomarinimicrobiota bacterium]